MKTKLQGYWQYFDSKENDNLSFRFIIFKDDTFFILIVDPSFKPIHISSEKYTIENDLIFVDTHILGQINFTSENSFSLTNISNDTNFIHNKVIYESIIKKIETMIS